MATKLYPTDQTDHQWKCIEQLLPAPATRGRKRQLDMRHVLDAILYVVVGGIPWRLWSGARCYQKSLPASGLEICSRERGRKQASV